jgi:cytochrome oxidase Cu insertion factor (SCO1/SenC/PrrC family)
VAARSLARAALVVMSLGAVAESAFAQGSERSAAELMDAVMWNREPIGGSVALMDHNGKLRTDADFRGKLMLVYFGFTYCPDVCPTDLQNIGLALDKLGASGEEVQPLFITLDPERDSSCVAV